MKKFKLNIGQRIRAYEITNSYKGDIAGLSNSMDDLKKLELSKEEIKKINFRTIVRKINEEGGTATQYLWGTDDSGKPSDEVSKDVLKDIELNESTAEFITDTINTKDKEKSLTKNDLILVELKKVLEEK